jgi:hypothetical protein
MDDTITCTNGNGESKIRKVLFNEISLFIAGVSLVIGALFWILNPMQSTQIQLTKLQTQVENNATVAEKLQNIKDNDLHELKLRMDRIETRQIEELEAIARIEVLLKK